MASASPVLEVDLAGLALRSPLIAAAGTWGSVDELADVSDVSVFGALVTKSITREPRLGNQPLRIVDAGPGMLNAIGLANVGLDAFLRDKLPRAAHLPCPLIGSMAGHSIHEYVTVASAFDGAEHLAAVELNVSCPNTETGLEFGTSAAQLRALLNEVRPVLRHKKMIVKLSPNTGDIVSLARAAIEGGADALTLINTVQALAIDVETRRPRLSRGAGGLSGPAIHPIAVRMVREVFTKIARDANIPIIGLGGVMNWRDAAEMILAGATAVGLGTVLFVNPRQPVKIHRGLAQWVRRQRCTSITELVGAMREA